MAVELVGVAMFADVPDDGAFGSTPLVGVRAAAFDGIITIEPKAALVKELPSGRVVPIKSRKPKKKPATKKRTLSPEAKAKLVANLAKARAARAAKKTKA